MLSHGDCIQVYVTDTVLEFLDKGDLGRMFFVNQFFRGKTMQTHHRKRLLTKDYLYVETIDYPVRSDTMYFRFPWNCCEEAIALLQNYIQAGAVYLNVFTVRRRIFPVWTNAYAWVMALRWGQVSVAEKLRMEQFTLGLIDGNEKNQLYRLRGFVLQNVSPEYSSFWFMRYNQFINEFSVPWRMLDQVHLLDAIRVVWLVHKVRPALVDVDKALEGIKRVLQKDKHKVHCIFQSFDRVRDKVH